MKNLTQYAYTKHENDTTIRRMWDFIGRSSVDGQYTDSHSYDTVVKKEADREDRKRDSKQIHVSHTNTPIKLIQY